MTENEARKNVRDYLNGELKDQELLNMFELKKCKCSNYELEEDLVYHKWDLGEQEEKICESCRNDE